MQEERGPTLGQRLRRERRRKNLTQEALARALGTTARSVRRWERDIAVPQLYYREAFRRVLGLEAAPAAEAPDPGALVLSGLGLAPTRLIGRDQIVTQACQLIRRGGVRLLTFTGPPGVGKTRLAVEVAARLRPAFPEVVPVALAPLTDAGMVGPTVRHALGVPELPGRGADEALVEGCRDRSLLLLLDNFEHLPGAAPLLAAMLTHCPGVRILVTSRASIHIRGERELPVQPLATAPAVAFLVDRATAVSPGFRLTADNAAAVTGLCQRLEGIPLAIELAAPWLKLLTPAELLERLEPRLAWLVGGQRDLPDRQRTMSSTLAWSYALLTPEQQALFRRLSVFRGSASLEATEVVCQAAGPMPGGPPSSLAGLVDHNLVRRLETEGEPRVGMLETVREYAAEMLDRSGEGDATARALGEHLAEVAVESSRGLIGPGHRGAMARLDRDLDSLRASMRWALARGERELGLRLSAPLWKYWLRRGAREEGLRWLEAMLDGCGPVAPATRAAALYAAGQLSATLNLPDGAAARYEESLALWRALGDRRGAADALGGMAVLAASQSDFARGSALFEETLLEFRAVGDQHGVALTLANLASVAVCRGDYARGRALGEEALATWRPLGNEASIAGCLANLGELARIEGDLARAGECLYEAVAINRRLGLRRELAIALAFLGCVLRAGDDLGAARAAYSEALELMRGVHDRVGMGYCLERLAWLDGADGCDLQAARLAGAASGLRKGSGIPIASVPHPEDERVEAAVRGRLGRTAFDAEFAAGAVLDVDEAVRLALHTR